MAVAYESSTTVAPTTASSIALTKPSGLAIGDLMVAHLLLTVGQTVSSAPTGFTFKDTATDSTSLFTSDIYYKTADSGDVAASTFTFTLSGSSSCGGALLRVSGATSSTSISEYGEANIVVSTTTPSFANTVTPHVASSLLLFMITHANASAISAYAVATSNPSWTEVYDVVGGVRGLACAWAVRPEVTATGNSSVTCSSTNQITSQMLVIMPTFLSTISDSTTVTDTVQQMVAVFPTDSVTPTDTITAIKQKTWATLDKIATTWSNLLKS